MFTESASSVRGSRPQIASVSRAGWILSRTPGPKILLGGISALARCGCVLAPGGTTPHPSRYHLPSLVKIFAAATLFVSFGSLFDFAALHT